MKIIYNKIFLEHETGAHPENKKRLESLGSLLQTKLLSGEKYLELFHTKKYIEFMKKACNKGGCIDADTVVSKKSYDAAVHAVGAAIMASETNDFALVRPPGHHAHPSHSGGFCIFNNTAIAVQKLVDEGKRVLIFDFDSHFGDGTEKFFYKTDKVMYWSLHQFPAFPGGGDADEIGEDKGKGYTMNIPLPPKAGDDIYMKSVNTFMPIAKKFKPDIIAVSAGFDGHQHDPLLDLRLSVNTYYKLGKIIRKNFKKVFAVLEGGYNVKILPKCIFNFIDGMNNKKKRFNEQETDSTIQVINESEFRIDKLEKNLSEFWKI